DLHAKGILPLRGDGALRPGIRRARRPATRARLLARRPRLRHGHAGRQAAGGPVCGPDPALVWALRCMPAAAGTARQRGPRRRQRLESDPAAGTAEPTRAPRADCRAPLQPRSALSGRAVPGRLGALPVREGTEDRLRGVGLVRVVIPSVNYADFLADTLPAWQAFLPRDAKIAVVTTPEDRETQAVAASCDVPCCVTDVWTRDGAIFNKGSALDLAFGF